MPPAARIAAATSSQAAPLRLEITTCAPAPASASAIARPMPREEPVTIAVLPREIEECLWPDHRRFSIGMRNQSQLSVSTRIMPAKAT